MPSFAVLQARALQSTRWLNHPHIRRRPSNLPNSGWIPGRKSRAYLGRDVTTVQRCEKRETMPVHRHVHDKRGSVYAVAPELDAWLKSRRQQLVDDQDDKEQEPDAPVEVQADHGPGATLRTRRWIALAAVGVLGLLAAAYVVSDRKSTTSE